MAHPKSPAPKIEGQLTCISDRIEHAWHPNVAWTICVVLALSEGRGVLCVVMEGAELGLLVYASKRALQILLTPSLLRPQPYSYQNICHSDP